MPSQQAQRGNLLWSQEFRTQESSKPNAEVWNFEIGDGTANSIPGWGNQELEYYREENAIVSPDCGLVITAERNTDPSLMAYYGRPAEWTSARLQSLGKVHFHYGDFEIRAKLPAGGGTWPALWFLGADIVTAGWPSCGEIDIAETRGDMPDVLFTTVHGPGYSGEHGVGRKDSQGVDLSLEFHTYGLTWLPGRISWSLDGQEKFAITSHDVPGEWVFDHPHFMIMNLAVGGNFTGEVDPNLTQVQMKVEYIRQYAIGDFGSVWTA